MALVLGVLLTTPASTQENRGSAGYLLPRSNSWLQVASLDLGAVNVIGVWAVFLKVKLFWAAKRPFLSRQPNKCMEFTVT